MPRTEASRSWQRNSARLVEPVGAEWRPMGLSPPGLQMWELGSRRPSRKTREDNEKAAFLQARGRGTATVRGAALQPLSAMSPLDRSLRVRQGGHRTPWPSRPVVKPVAAATHMGRSYFLDTVVFPPSDVFPEVALLRDRAVPFSFFEAPPSCVFCRLRQHSLLPGVWPQTCRRVRSRSSPSVRSAAAWCQVPSQVLAGRLDSFGETSIPILCPFLNGVSHLFIIVLQGLYVFLIQMP